MKFEKLLNLKPSLERLGAKDLPIQVSFKLGKLIKQLNIQYGIFAENKKKLFDKYGETKNNQTVIKKENTKQFNVELEELLNIDVDLQIEKINLKDFGDIKISAIDMFNLDILIEE